MITRQAAFGLRLAEAKVHHQDLLNTGLEASQNREPEHAEPFLPSRTHGNLYRIGNDPMGLLDRIAAEMYHSWQAHRMSC